MKRRAGDVGLIVVMGLPLIACEGRTVQWCGPSEPAAAALSDIAAPGGGLAAWPGEPPGMVVVFDGPFRALNRDGWRGVERQTTNGSGLAILPDPTAPRSPSGVLTFGFAPGFPGGTSPGVVFFNLPAPARETYFGFWWKPSNPWQNHDASGVNKIALMFPATSGAGTLYVMMFFDGTKYTIQTETTFPGDTRRLEPNLTATPVELGAWHQVGWYVKYSSSATSRDGVVQWWVNGVPQGAYSDLQMPRDAGVREYQLAPVWGGVGEFKAQRDCFWYDHAHIGIR